MGKLNISSKKTEKIRHTHIKLKKKKKGTRQHFIFPNGDISQRNKRLKYIAKEVQIGSI